MLENHKFQKKNLRKFLLDRRKELSFEYEKINKAHIHIRTFLENIDKCYIGSYLNFRNEICTSLIHELLISMGFKIGLPCINEEDPNMIFRNWTTKDELIANKYGIFQPQENAEQIEPKVIIVPLVGFSISGYRLGYGGGYYDRFIESRNKISSFVKIGLGYTFQEVKELPYEKHDQKLDWILTEKYLYKVK